MTEMIEIKPVTTTTVKVGDELTVQHTHGETMSDLEHLCGMADIGDTIVVSTVDPLDNTVCTSSPWGSFWYPLEWFEVDNTNLRTSISIEWGADDVLAQDSALTPTQVSTVLDRMLRDHDATIGINWDVIDHHIAEVLADAKS